MHIISNKILKVVKLISNKGPSAGSGDYGRGDFIQIHNQKKKGGKIPKTTNLNLMIYFQKNVGEYIFRRDAFRKVQCF